MKLRGLGAAAALALMAATGAFAQKAEKVPRVGLLLPTSGPGGHIHLFIKAMADLGYVEGQTIVYEKRYADGRDAAYAEGALEFAKMPVDVIIAAGPSAARAARAATGTVPIVMGTVDPVEQGLVASLAKPGGNVTGFGLLTSDGGQKALALLKESMPRLSRVALLSNPRMAGHGRVIENLQAGARNLGVQLVPLEAASRDAFEPAFEAMAREKVDAFLVLPEPVVMDPGARALATLASRHRIPGMYQWRSYADAGGLMSYGPSLAELVPQWAPQVDRIIKGAKPGDLPVMTARKYELVLNERAAKSIGFTFPAALRLAADDVIR